MRSTFSSVLNIFEGESPTTPSTPPPKRLIAPMVESIFPESSFCESEFLLNIVLDAPLEEGGCQEASSISIEMDESDIYRTLEELKLLVIEIAKKVFSDLEERGGEQVGFTKMLNRFELPFFTSPLPLLLRDSSTFPFDIDPETEESKDRGSSSSCGSGSGGSGGSEEDIPVGRILVVIRDVRDFDFLLRMEGYDTDLEVLENFSFILRDNWLLKNTDTIFGACCLR